MWRDFQTQWETCFWFSTERLFHSLPASRFPLFQQRPTLRVIAPDDVRSVTDGPGAIQMLVHQHSAAGQTATPAGGLDLQPVVSELNGIVASHRAGLLDGEDQVQIPMPTRQEGAARLSRLDPETPVELGDVFVA